MATVTFTVGEINEREATTKFGVKKVYDLIATDGTKYKLGFTAPSKVGIVVGALVTGEATTDRFGVALDGKTVRVGGTATPTAPIVSAGVKSNAKDNFVPKVFPVPPTHGDMAIIRQNALTNAVATVADFVATQAADKWPDLETWGDMVINVAYKYAKFSSGHREVEAIEKLRGVGVSSTDIQTAIAAHDSDSEAA